MIRVFFSYSHADEDLRDQLEKHLAGLKRQGVIDAWHDRRIDAGTEVDGSIDCHLNEADIILLLVSSDFLASDYCYEREMALALERHKAGRAVVVPVVLRPCDWKNAPFGGLMAVPTDGHPVTKWPDRDEAFLDVAIAIRKIAEARGGGSVKPVPKREGSTPSLGTDVARSSNLRVAKQFTEKDRDDFLHDSFEYIASFFENSLGELERRNPGIEGRFRRVDANRFTVAVYENGSARSKCTIFLGGSLGGIAYTHGESSSGTSYNESLTVAADDQHLFLRSFGFSSVGGRERKLSRDGAADLYWGMFIEPLQRR